MNLQKQIYKVTKDLKNNSSTILTILAAAGVVGTTITTMHATTKISKMDIDDENRSLEIIKAYAPPVIIGVSTIACIFGANILNQKHQAALQSAYALMDSSYKNYRSTLINLHGEEVDREVQDNMARKYCNYHQLGLDEPDDKKLTFYEPISGRTIKAYEREIMDAEYHMNRNFAIAGCASLNDFYEFLGLPKTDYGKVMGWSYCAGYSWIDFEHRLIKNDDGSYFYSIEAMFPPEEDYDGEYL